MASSQRDRWFRRFHPAEDSRVELVCFPHAGGSASSWYALSAALSPAVPVLAVQYPGRQDRHREPVVADLHTMADHVTEALGAGGGPPPVLLGHSMGASLAYEVAVRLGRGGSGPAALVVSGRRAPARRRLDPALTPDDDVILRKVRSLGGTNKALLDDPELRELILPGLRGDYRALREYRDSAGPRLSCPVLALTGDRDPEAPAADMRAWQDRTTGDFAQQVLPGGHFFLEEQVPVVAGLLLRFLNALAPPAAPARPGT